MIQTNIIHSAYLMGVKKLLLLGSSCIYPRDSEIPIRESSLLTGPLEPTNEAYAIAKITGIKLCDYYREQYGCDFISVMPSNTFGPFDTFDLKTGHILPALIHKMHLAKIRDEKTVSIWGTGKPLREMIYVNDVADGLIFLMNKYSQPGIINLGTGQDLSVREIAETIKKVVNYQGELAFDTSRPDGVYRKVMDVSLIKSMGWQPSTLFEDGIKQTYDWFVENFEKLSSHPVYDKKPSLITSSKLTQRMKRRLIRPELLNKSLDNPEIMAVYRNVILSKPFLKALYISRYQEFVQIEEQIKDTPGLSIELGSGAGFLKSLLPQVSTTDIRNFPDIDRVEHAHYLSFKDLELKAIYSAGVLHHLGNPRAFFKEASRCLRKGGVLVLIEPHMSTFGRFFFRVLHYESNDLSTRLWEFPQFGPLRDSNTAMPSLIFDRDFLQFKAEFPEFEIQKRTYHTFLLYAFSGGVSFKFSLPGFLFRPLALLENLLGPWMKKYLATMQTIVLVKK